MLGKVPVALLGDFIIFKLGANLPKFKISVRFMSSNIEPDKAVRAMGVSITD